MVHLLILLSLAPSCAAPGIFVYAWALDLALNTAAEPILLTNSNCVTVYMPLKDAPVFTKVPDFFFVIFLR